MVADFSFIHAADVHLDSPLAGLAAKDEAFSQLVRGATRRALRRGPAVVTFNRVAVGRSPASASPMSEGSLPSSGAIAASIAFAQSGSSSASASRSEISAGTAKLLTQVQVNETSVAVTLDRAALLQELGHDLAHGDQQPASLTITAPATRVRRGKDVKLVFGTSAGPAVQVDSKLVALLDEAHAARDAIACHPEWAMRDAAAALRQCRHRLAQLVRLSFLAPSIVDAIRLGTHPATLTPRQLLAADLPLAWPEQQAMLGSGLIDQSQKITVAARAMAEKKTVGQRS